MGDGQGRRRPAQLGWRAVAIPVLAVLTVLAVLNVDRHDSPSRPPDAVSAPSSSASSSAPPPIATGTRALKGDAAGAGTSTTPLPTDALPPGGPYTLQGAGSYRVLPGSGPVVGTGRLFTYTVEVENGITGIDLAAFANTVQRVLSDARSWTHGGVALQRIGSGTPTFHITLTSSMTVRQLCGYQIAVETSCYAPQGQGGSDVNRVVINDSRWVRGDAAYIGDLAAYQTYMINHETGHALGHLHAHNCLADGLAPAMMQQTIGLIAANGEICQSNPWPYPAGATDAPGPEAPDTTANDEFNLQHQ